MRYLVNGREMKQYDAVTTEHFKVPSLLLMERAALALAEEIKKETSPQDTVLIVCGTGNNGADGLAAARMLLLCHTETDIVLIGNREKMSEPCRKQLEILNAYGFTVFDAIPAQKTYSMVVDALFGVGLSRNVEGIFAAVIGQMNGMNAKKIAADVPSGISSDTGEVLGTAFSADKTVTFAFEKLGLYLWPGNEYAGEVILKQIGITEESFLGCAPPVRALEETDIAALPKRPSHSNKGTFGKVLLIAGNVSMAGAAVLSARAAYAAGCGLVRVFTPVENRAVIQTAVPEAVVTAYDNSDTAQSALSDLIQWADAIVCGPGIGKGETAHQIVKNVLKNAAVPVVLDADALNITAEDTALLSASHAPLIITPHLGEMSRLTRKTVGAIQHRLLQTAQEFAETYNVICVLKDERTAVCTPSGTSYLNLSGNNGMATAGSGDVLSGIIGSLLAQKTECASAAAAGVFLHGKAGDTARRITGLHGMTAGDIIFGLQHFFAENGL